jgi:hypothetical protein
MGYLVDLAKRATESKPETLTRTEESELRRWLAAIEEHDPAIISYMLDRCRTDAGAREYFLRHARGEYLH